LKYYEQLKNESPEVFNKVLAKEFKVHEMMVMKYPRNYPAWLYRKFLVDEFYLKRKQYDRVLPRNFEFIKDFCEKNIHENCAFHHLQYLLRETYDMPFTAIGNEIEWANSLVKKYQEYYRYENEHQGMSEVNYFNLESLKIHIKFLNALNDGKLQKKQSN